ncbi:chemotaxis protein CheD [Vibrio atypicus]|jgi:chemotaxis protein CheD|uniref:chemotaxis protein CheD n=1 Tax=Vibrio atypicus TaxID=558271 RepID=UPI0013598691|nr:chemotaxis protein CheD [Vibrio atypicus]
MIAVREHQPRHKNSHFNRFYHPQKEKHIIKVLPGGLYCTQNKDEIIATGLGSCIAACAWDDDVGVGGMNHFLLPFDNPNQVKSWQPNSLVSTASRYGTHAMEMLLNSLIDRGASRENLQFKLFGGAQMLGRSSMIGEKNVVFVLNYAEQEHLKIVAQDLGGLEPRKVMFDPLTGKAWLKRIPFTEVHHLQHQEEKYASQLDKESHRKHDDDVELF